MDKIFKEIVIMNKTIVLFVLTSIFLAYGVSSFGSTCEKLPKKIHAY